MKKLYVVKHQQDFDRIIKLNNKKVSPYFIIYSEDNNKKYDCYGISVSKKIGNAVVRNKLKRQIKNIIDKKCYENSFNCIIILRKGILNKSFNEMSEELYSAFEILKLFKEERSEKE